ncbi:pyrin [Chelmon rostratus]|uniref:pyrin n=1 Tax=Chelmon rostratus TaxID=109905 RepID=UPI001BEADC1C|nr:pyrin [Chelmon rostratus]XP_041789965.1 pyrin [Chelmon rostratus]XP_041789966.1 pyrin [Chelmon rostratus]
MPVPQLLFDTLEDLVNDEFKTFKWYLSQRLLDSCSPIRRSHLEMASRTETVSKMTESYGEELAVNITAEILKKMGFNSTAAELKRKYAEGRMPSTSSSAVAPPAAPATMMAQQGSVIIAPSVTGGTSGSWNITINK